MKIPRGRARANRIVNFRSPQAYMINPSAAHICCGAMPRCERGGTLGERFPVGRNVQMCASASATEEAAWWRPPQQVIYLPAICAAQILRWACGWLRPGFSNIYRFPA